MGNWRLISTDKATVCCFVLAQRTQVIPYLLTSTLPMDSWQGVGAHNTYGQYKTLTKQKFSNKHSHNRWLVINTNRWPRPVEQEKKILTIKMAKTRRSQLRWLGLGAHNKIGQDQALTIHLSLAMHVFLNPIQLPRIKRSQFPLMIDNYSTISTPRCYSTGIDSWRSLTMIF